MNSHEMCDGHRAVIESVADAAPRWIHPAYRHNDPLIPETQAITSRDQYVAAYSGFADAFPGMRSIAEAVLAQGNLSAARWRFEGTFSAEFRDVQPTGDKVEYWGMTIYRWDGDLIVEGWSLFDVVGFNTQMGLGQ